MKRQVIETKETKVVIEMDAEELTDFIISNLKGEGIASYGTVEFDVSSAGFLRGITVTSIKHETL